MDNVGRNGTFNFVSICNRLDEMISKFDVSRRESSVERDIKE